MTGPNEITAGVRIDRSKPMVASIPVTRFIRPNGQRQQESTKVSVEVLVAWRQLQEHYKGKLTLTIEDLNNGTTSLCLQHADKGDLEMRVIANKDTSKKDVVFKGMIRTLYTRLGDSQKPELAAKPIKCADGQCANHRNMNGGCDVCGAPSL